MRSIVLTVIGGGSVNWMFGLMRDLFILDEIGGGEIRLVDPNREHVEAVRAMLLTFNRLRNKDYKILIVDDRRAALRGAQFVLTTFSPGEMDAFFYDLELPIKYGVRLPVSMTVGLSGISAALRTVPIAYELVQEMEELCPGAWLLNVTNPMSVVTRAMNLASKTVHVLGLCHEVNALPGYLERTLGLKCPEGLSGTDFIYRKSEMQNFQYTVAGLNHFVWLTQAVWKGEDMLPRIRQYAQRHVGWGHPIGTDGPPISNSWHNNGEAKLALCRTFGYLPIPGDRHLVEFLPSLCNPLNGFAMKYGVQKTTVDSRRLRKIKQLETIRRIASGEEPVKWVGSGEECMLALSAVVTGKPLQTIVNLPNTGQISNLPKDVVVETLGVVSGSGCKPLPAGDLPGPIASLCRLHADVQEQTLRAALEGNRDLLRQTCALDPSSAGMDFSQIGALVDELLNANKSHLPRFFK